MRAQAARLKCEIEAKLAQRIPSALSPIAQQLPRLHPVDNGPIDALLGGGLPLGSVCEVTGPEGAGHASFAFALLASASVSAACAYVDVSDTLSPHSAAASGVELLNLLWVRCMAARVASPSPARSPMREEPPRTGALNRRSISGGCGSSHPRGETKGLAPALEQMLSPGAERRRRKLEGTPGHPNQPLGLHTASQDQVEWERFNLRRVDETDPLWQLDRQAAERARERAASREPRAVELPCKQQSSSDPVSRALRATDQILQAGGFRVVVLDLTSVDPQQARRIPCATWFRYRRAAQESDALMLLLTREPCAGSSAACVLECVAGEAPRVQGVLTAVPRAAAVGRQRTAPVSGRKAPGRATSWAAMPAAMRAVGE